MSGSRAADAAPDAAPRPAPASSAWSAGLGAGFVVLGGLVAAVSGPLALRDGSWLAAYLVLVCGVSQYAMGRAPAWFGIRRAGPGGWLRLAGWNLGNALVVAGTLLTAPFVVDAGGAVLLAVLVALLIDALRRPGSADREHPLRRWGRRAFMALLVVLIVSVPVGLVLAHLRA